jgi:hypothetical protein
MPGTPARVERVASLLSLVALLTATSSAHAQQRARLQPELRMDAIDVRSADEGTVHAGIGVGFPLGYYARLNVVGAGGVTRRRDLEVGSGRVDLIARILLDPFREARWGLSLGGGMSIEHAAGADWRELLLLLLDAEAPPVRRLVVPTFQVGLGGGVRIGIIARRYQQGRR